MKSNKSKGERVREVRRILATFCVDIQQVHLSVYASSLDLSGVLIKYDGNDLTSSEVSALVDSLSPYGFLTTTLSNWNLTNGHIVKLKTPDSA